MIRKILTFVAVVLTYAVLIAIAISCGLGIKLAFEASQFLGLLGVLSLLAPMPLIAVSTNKQRLLAAVCPGALFLLLPTLAISQFGYGVDLTPQVLQVATQGLQIVGNVMQVVSDGAAWIGLG